MVLRSTAKQHRVILRSVATKDLKRFFAYAKSRQGYSKMTNNPQGRILWVVSMHIQSNPSI